MGIAQERYFYRLQELNDKEQNFILNFAFDNSYGSLKKGNEEWLNLFSFLFKYKKTLYKNGVMDVHAEKIFNDAEIQLEESFHSLIEGQSKKYLDMLLNRDTSFYDEDQTAAMEFCFFFAMQYVRTPRILENMKESIIGIADFDVKKVWSVTKIIVATNIAWSMFSKRLQFKMYVLRSNSIKFITGDQPIINTHAVNFEHSPEKVEWFYPISPDLAILISETEREKISWITESEVMNYNQMIFKSSNEQIYAIEETDLLRFKSN